VWYTVVGKDPIRNRVTLRSTDGEKITYNPAHHFGIEDVFTVEKRVFTAGDMVQLRGTDRNAGVRSGELATVLSVDDEGRMIVETKTGLRKLIELTQYRTLDYAYASTGHSAQSRTVDNVIVLQTSGHRKEVVNQASFYVGASRTRGEFFLVVDDFERAKEAMEREYEKSAALDIADGRTPSEQVLPELRMAENRRLGRAQSLQLSRGIPLGHAD
jgi:ATP-dependent exoDNAse (exonuclease V) alpha subunit